MNDDHLKLQHHIERILSTSPSPRQIAENFLNKPSDHIYQFKGEPIGFEESVKACRVRLGKELTSIIEQRRDSNLLLYRIYAAAYFFEPIIFLEMGLAKVEEFEKCICNPKKKDDVKRLNAIKANIKAIDRVMKNNPLSISASDELNARKHWLEEVFKKGAIRVSNQQITALQYLVFSDIRSAPLIKDFILLRNQGTQSIAYRQALLVIIAELLAQHSKNNTQSQRGRVWALTVKTINALLPTLQKSINGNRPITETSVRDALLEK